MKDSPSTVDDYNQSMPNTGQNIIRTFIAILVLISHPWLVRAAKEPLADPLILGSSQNIILLIGDGMGAGQRTAARWYNSGLEGNLAMDLLPAEGLAHTASADSSITDSAASATAIATGVKTNNGIIGMDPEYMVLDTILEQAKMHGMATGMVTTVQVTHATPAAFSAHVPSRSMTEEIALQLLGTRVDVILGGGEDDFLPASATGCYPSSGKRADDRDLIEEAISAGYTYVCDAEGLMAVNAGHTSHLLGLFADEEVQRPYSPSLEQMTEVAIAILSQDPDGFFLLVEGGQIDWACHAQDAENAIMDTIDFDQVIAQAVVFAQSEPQTLVIVAADHETGGMSVSEVSSGLPSEDGPFLMPDGKTFYVNWSTNAHTAAPVPVSAQGPAAELVFGEFENTYIHDIMFASAGFADFKRVYLPLSMHHFNNFPK